MKNNLIFFLAVCGLAAMGPLMSGYLTGNVRTVEGFAGWPSSWEGVPLHRVPLGWRELRFAEGFPGEIAHFSDGRRMLLMRYTRAATRKLHPAADCFRGAGYQVKPPAIFKDAKGDEWSVFEASRDGETYRVQERIFENGGRSWTNAGAWYWSAAYGRSKGPWWAVTIVEKTESKAELK